MTNIEDTSEVTLKTSGSGDSSLENAQHRDPITSDEARQLMNILFGAAINGVVSVLGSTANIITIIVFIKQGFNDSVNISLCGLAVSDLGALLFQVWRSICFYPLPVIWNLEFDPFQIQYITAAWPHGFFVRVRSLITAFITFERCVCVALPLKVKNIITPRRTFISIIVIVTIMLASVVPVFCSVNLVKLFKASRNKTFYEIVYVSNGVLLERLSFSLNVSIQLSSFIIVSICTVVLINLLTAKSRWRHSATVVFTTSHSDTMSPRDKRVVKMVTSISCIFIACYLPGIVNMIMRIGFSPDYTNGGRYSNTYQASWAVFELLEAVNSSVGILVYYNMGSKFRTSFNHLFGPVPNRKRLV